MKKLTQEQADKLADAYRTNPRIFSEDCLFIAPKDKHLTGVIPLVYSPIQSQTHDICEHVKKLCGRERYINLKARQVYLTTYWTSRAYHYHWFAEGPRQTDLMGDMGKTTQSMKEMWDRYYDFLPYFMQRPMHGQRGRLSPGFRQSTQTHRFLDTGAHIKMHTALSRNKRSGQGTTGSTLVATEVPYYDYGEEILLAMLNALADKDGTLAVLEGTANGAQGIFYEKWLEAVDHSDQLCKRFGARNLDDLLWNRSGWGNTPDSDGNLHPEGFWDGTFLPLFWAWHQNPEYTLDPQVEGVTDDNLTAEEVEMKESHRLTLGQIAWRRYAIREKCNKSVRKFQQEYPATWLEAFLMSGSPVFDPVIVSQNIQRTEGLKTRTAQTPNGKIVPIIQQLDLRWSKENYPKSEPRYNEYGLCVNVDTLQSEAFTAPGDFLLRRTPKGGYYDRYVIGADVAQGLAQGDYSVAYVYDMVDRQVAMEYRGHCTEKRFAEILAMMGYYYKKAHILVESNVGRAVIDPLLTIYNNVLNESDGRPGFTTTEKSKPVLIGEVLTWMDSEPHTNPFWNFWNECRTFSRDERGRMNAEGKRLNPSVKNFDDCVMAFALTLMAARLAPPPRPVREQPKDDIALQMEKSEKKRTIEEYMPSHI